MTIAACYVSPEGVVLGADSTTTMQRDGSPERRLVDHHYNFGQKIFEIGENSTLSAVFWGLGAINDLSYRTMLAQLSDSLLGQHPASVREVAERWRQHFWGEYGTRLGPAIARFRDLARMSPRSKDEQAELKRLATLSGGFCIAGRVLTDRNTHAFEVTFGPWMTDPPEPQEILPHFPKFWGCENLMNRLILGMDNEVYHAILRSGKWTGTPEDLAVLIRPYVLSVPMNLPLREAVDWIYASIYTTIKSMKFSQLAPVCGGPIEIATITTDRPFRWVSHKCLDEAIDRYRPMRRDF